ncbi:transmembrane protein 128 isoform X1 [Lynx rufus]|uniref:transmembrane protein 128 isoform X1 n=1 Tax=Lynx rufus TaxID=61384 RepID=UPI001F126439|nr:transmembrane protein 128 isoform X1 [Lynx rufus]
MDASRAREQLRRRYLFPRDTEAPLDSEGYAGPEVSTAVERKEKPLPRLNIHSGFWILASIVVTYYVDFFKTVKENFHTNSPPRKPPYLRGVHGTRFLLSRSKLQRETEGCHVVKGDAAPRADLCFGWWFVERGECTAVRDSLSSCCTCRPRPVSPHLPPDRGHLKAGVGELWAPVGPSPS